MHVEPVISSLRAALLQHAAIAGTDPVVEGAAQTLVDALGPALRLAAIQLAEQAAAEVDAQLNDQRVDLLLTDGEPTLRVGDRQRGGDRTPQQEDLDARITLRLPPSLKQLIERAAGDQGESVNGWVVEALDKRARRNVRAGRTVTESFDL